jgi:enamine deaminase RidA (YjgF/YER057c/UK114 family)
VHLVRKPIPLRAATSAEGEAGHGWQTRQMATPPSVRLIRSTQLSDRAPYAYAAVAEGAFRSVFTAGACPLDEHGHTVAPGDVAGQAEQVMANLRTALAAANANLTDVVKTTVYVATGRQEDLVAAWEVVHRHFGDHDAPSTLLGVSVLGYRDQLVEVEAIAATA